MDLKFPPPKCNAMHFNILQGLLISPIHTLNNHNIQYCNEIKFLGLTWDKKLSWKPYITKLKEKCLRTLNILKSITSKRWVGN